MNADPAVSSDIVEQGKSPALSSKAHSIDDVMLPIVKEYEPLAKGDNLLFEFGNRISLLKYEGAEIGSRDPLRVRANRHTNFYCIGNWLMPKEDDPFTHRDPQKRIVEKARIEILGSHRIDFRYDDEFDIYLPSSEGHTDLYLTLANKFGDGRVEKTVDTIYVTGDEELIMKRLSEITRAKYLETNLIPFIESRPTALHMPKDRTKINHLRMLMSLVLRIWDPYRPKYRTFERDVGSRWLYMTTKDMEHGDFVYVGSKEEVYLLGIAKDDDNRPYMQGTYTTSIKPLFFFSNNYLGSMSRFDMEKPLHQGDGPCNAAYFRTCGAPGFDGVPFVFSAMGRSQNCKNSIFTGEPDIITGSLEEALEHFKTTDFSEFDDIVRRYAENIRVENKHIGLASGCRHFY
jgi:hypothetical protein